MVVQTGSSVSWGSTSFAALCLVFALPFGIASDFFGFKSRGDSRSDQLIKLGLSHGDVVVPEVLVVTIFLQGKNERQLK